MSDDDIKRSLISGILIEEFGPEAVNDAKFQDIINDVTWVLNQSSKGRRLLSLAIQQLRNNGSSARAFALACVDKCIYGCK